MVFIPFLIIDMVVASVLMSMGMMMLSPVLVSLPFKLMLFVLVDGWNLLIGIAGADLSGMTPESVMTIVRQALEVAMLVAARCSWQRWSPGCWSASSRPRRRSTR